MERLVEAEVPIVFLAFPRLTTDPDYLFGKLAPLFPAETTIDQAREVQAKVFDIDKARVEGEPRGGERALLDCGAMNGLHFNDSVPDRITFCTVATRSSRAVSLIDRSRMKNSRRSQGICPPLHPRLSP